VLRSSLLSNPISRGNVTGASSSARVSFRPPRRGIVSSPSRLELQGEGSSREPHSKSFFIPSGKAMPPSTFPAPASCSPSAESSVFAEGLREHLSTPEPAGAVLLFRLPQGSPAVEEMEGATTLPKISQRQTEAAGAMPPESEEEEGRWLRTKTTCSSAREGHPHRFFFVRPPRLLSGVPAHHAVALAEVLFPRLPPRSGAGSEARETLAQRIVQKKIPEKRAPLLQRRKPADIFSAY
jgi:hypothetical protein